jgi:uncharacterized protein (TIGR02594 family)
MPGGQNYSGRGGGDAARPGQNTSDKPVGPQNGNDTNVPSDILAKAKQVALESGPDGVEKFMSENGYPKAGNWCGEFTAAVVRSSGGTPPKNPAIASNWRNYGTPVDTPQPGDIAVRKGVPTGSTGSHVTIVDSIDQNGSFMGVGGNQGIDPRTGQNRWLSRQSTDRYEFRRPPQPPKEEPKETPKDGTTPVEKDAAGSSQMKAFDGFVGDGRGEGSGFDLERWKWMRPKQEIENREGEDASQYMSASWRVQAEAKRVGYNMWSLAQPLPEATSLSKELGSDQLDSMLTRTRDTQFTINDVMNKLKPPPNTSQPQPSQRVYDTTGGLNNQETKTNQNVEVNDLDHRPRREAVQSQDFRDYTGTTSGAEDAD